MVLKRLLDTNAYSAFRKQDDNVRAEMAIADGILIPVVVAGELLAGFKQGSRYQVNRRELEEFLAEPTVRLVQPSLATADWYSRIWAVLKRQGTPIPTNDIWIAAQTLDEGATLISRDRHFEHVPGLSWICP